MNKLGSNKQYWSACIYLNLMNTLIFSFHNDNFNNLLVLVSSHSKIKVLDVDQHPKLESLIADNSALQ